MKIKPNRSNNLCIFYISFIFILINSTIVLTFSNNYQLAFSQGYIPPPPISPSQNSIQSSSPPMQQPQLQSQQQQPDQSGQPQLQQQPIQSSNQDKQQQPDQS